MSRLDEIKARAEQVHWTSTSIEQAMARMASSAADVPWLLAEVARLTAERDALAAQVARLAKPGDPDARMDAYYYGFTRTGVGLVDDILSAVAKAGKSYHGTDMWNEELYDGGTCESRIQDAADAAAEQIRATLAGCATDTSEQEAGHRCEPYYSRAECGQCGWQEQWCVTCSQPMCGCATETTDQDAMGRAVEHRERVQG